MKRRAIALLAVVLVLGGAAFAYFRHVQKRTDAQAQAVEQKDAAFKAAKNDAAKDDSDKKAPMDALLNTRSDDPDSLGQFHLMPDGSPVPPLPTSAPNKVKLGVVLFKYKGSQGASDSTRSRESAQALAKEAVEIAKKDFEAAVKKGDRGSAANIGWMKQRILERSVEYAVFSLAQGDVSPEPVDTPRGYWVVKRLR